MRAAILFAVSFALAQSPAPLFTAASRVTVGQGSGTVLLADVNGDGRTDLLTNHLLSRQLGIQLGDGTGGFQAAAPLTFDFDPAGPLLADFNKDGTLDLAVTQGARDIVHVFRGSGKGTFTKAASYTVTDAAEPFNKRTLHAVDVNGDGHLDLVTANGRLRNTIRILFGDVNGDGALDLVLPNVRSVAVFIRRGETFAPASGSPYPAGPGAFGGAVADLNGDGKLDVVSSSFEGDSVTLLLRR